MALLRYVLIHVCVVDSENSFSVWVCVCVCYSARKDARIFHAKENNIFSVSRRSRCIEGNQDGARCLNQIFIHGAL